ncbi:hypothetical protein R0J93_20700, partial [Pseudoalteromonas sp. SIMBA_148]
SRKWKKRLSDSDPARDHPNRMIRANAEENASCPTAWGVRGSGPREITPLMHWWGKEEKEQQERPK